MKRLLTAAAGPVLAEGFARLASGAVLLALRAVA
jgi:hypothetical protein